MTAGSRLAAAVPEVTMTPKPVRGRSLRVQVDDTIPMVLEVANRPYAMWIDKGGERWLSASARTSILCPKPSVRQ